MKDYGSEWQRTDPDLVVYRPATENGYDSVNQHFLVTKSPGGAWLAFWTQGADEGEINQSVVVSRSEDRGRTWSPPTVIDGPLSTNPEYAAPDQRDVEWRAPGVSDEEGRRHAGIASWQFPIVAERYNRIYLFYWMCTGKADFRYDIGGVLLYRYSEDEGVTWSDPPFELPLHKTAGDNPDPEIPVNWIIWQIPYVTSRGEVIAPFTCWNSAQSNAAPGADSYFLRFDNVLTEKDPSRLTSTTLPQGARGLRVPSCMEPEESFCEEPAIVELSDGRLFCVMRTDAGYIAFSTSSDGGSSWTTPAPLYREDGRLMLNPVVPCPIWKLRDGRYLLQYCNNKGDAHGGHFPCRYACWRSNRYPAVLSVGREDLQNPACPVRFGPPKVIADPQGVPIGPAARTDAASYSSLLEDAGERILFYPDRKHFLLGKYIPDEWLDG